MKLFVWRGERVLKNYRSGLVVIAAETENDAWDRLYAADRNAWWHLQYGIRHVFDKDGEEFLNEDDFDDWEPVYPEALDLASLPVLVVHGGE